MIADTFLGLMALLYYFCFLLLTGLVCFIAWKKSRHTRLRSRLWRTFFLLAFFLLLWQITLFLEVRMALPAVQLWLGRANFTAIVFVTYFALRFVQEVSAKSSFPLSRLSWCLLAETVVLAALTLLTPFITIAERIEESHAITTFGPLFPCYLLHVVGYLIAALILAFLERRRTKSRLVRGQLMFIGLGMLATGSVALVTNALIPYRYGDFRFCDFGTLSTLFFVLAVAYAVLLHRLFAVRVILRETLVYGVLLTFVLGLYSSTVFVVTLYLTNSAGKMTQFVVLLIAFSFDPLRRFLEKKVDRLLFSRHRMRRQNRKQQA